MTLPTERTSRAVRSGRINRRPASCSASLIALAVVFALAWMFFVRSGPSASAPVVTGIQGTYTWQPEGGALGAQGRFGAVAGGDAGGTSKLDGVSLDQTPPQSAYDAKSKTETTTGGPGAQTSYRRTVGAWPPVWRVATHSPLDYQGLAAIVRTAVEDGDHAVGTKPVKDGDRAAWRAAIPLGGKEIDLVVDQQTGVVTWYSDGKATFTANVEWASPPPPDTTYSVETGGMKATTTRAEVSYEDSPAAAGRTAGYDPLVSDLAPDGYALQAVATIRADMRPLSWISDKVVSLPTGPRGRAVLELYTRGLSQFTVEQVGPATMRFWASVPDWASEATPGRLSYQETTLQYGAFKGATASTWYQESGPSLLVAGKRRAVFVTGALTRQELIAYAEGLEAGPRGQVAATGRRRPQSARRAGGVSPAAPR